MTMSVGEIRDKLVDLGMSKEEAESIKGKQNLLDKLEEYERGESLEEFDFEEVSDEELKAKELTSDHPVRGEVGWHDYVMTLFHEDELFETYPTLKGLRRVACALFGPILNSEIVKLESSLDPGGPGRAFCVYRIITPEGSFDGAADAWSGNTHKTYLTYPVAMAENRAEARAYRKLLMLNVVTAEEMNGESSKGEFVPVLSGEYNESDLMSSQQHAIVKSLSDKLGINPEKFLESEGYVENKTNKEEARALVNKLNEYLKDRNSIPEEIKKG